MKYGTPFMLMKIRIKKEICRKSEIKGKYLQKKRHYKEITFLKVSFAFSKIYKGIISS